MDIMKVALPPETIRLGRTVYYPHPNQGSDEKVAYCNILCPAH